MATAESVKANLQNIIAKANGKTGRTDSNVNSAVDALIDGYGKGDGITPSGTKTITENGTHDVTAYANALVNVPVGVTPSGTKTITSNGSHDVTNYATAQVNVPVGITPSGTKTITENGTHDVTAYANAQVNVAGLNARIFAATVANDVTSGTATIAGNNDWIKSIRNNPNAFVLVRYLGVGPSAAMTGLWFNANFKIAYSGATAYNGLTYRQTASTASTAQIVNGLTGANYGGNLCVGENGNLYVYVNASFPVKAGQYQIIAGLVEMV